jgi:hypothetical protein
MRTKSVVGWSVRQHGATEGRLLLPQWRSLFQTFNSNTTQNTFIYVYVIYNTVYCYTPVSTKMLLWSDQWQWVFHVGDIGEGLMCKSTWFGAQQMRHVEVYGDRIWNVFCPRAINWVGNDEDTWHRFCSLFFMSIHASRWNLRNWVNKIPSLFIIKEPRTNKQRGCNFYLVLERILNY